MTLIGAALPILLSAFAPAPPNRLPLRRIGRRRPPGGRHRHPRRPGIPDRRGGRPGRRPGGGRGGPALPRGGAPLRRRAAAGPWARIPSPRWTRSSALVKRLGPAGHGRCPGPRPHGRARRALRRVSRRAARATHPISRSAPRSTAPTARAATATSAAATDRWRPDWIRRPPNLADWAALRDQSPLDFYRRVSIGVVGTAMPAFEDRLPARDRWAVALYASTLRLPPASGEAPQACRASPPPARCPTPSCSTRSARRQDGSGGGLARARGGPRPPERSSAAGEVLAGSRAEVDSAYAMARTGDPGRRHHGPQRLHDLRAGRARAREARTPAWPPSWRPTFAALRAAAIQGAGPPSSTRRERGLTEGLDRAGDGARRGALAAQPVHPVLRDHAARGPRGDPDRRRADDVPRQDGRRRTAGAMSTRAFSPRSSRACSPRSRWRRCSTSRRRTRRRSKGVTMVRRHRGPVLRELLAAEQDGSGEVEPFRQEQGARRRHQRLRARARLGGVSRGVPRGIRDGAVLQGADHLRRRHGRGARSDRRRACWSGARAARRRLRRDEPVRHPAAAQAVLRGDQRLPVLHGLRLRRGRDRRAAGGRVRAADPGVVGAADTGTRHPSDGRDAGGPGSSWSVLALVALVWTFVIEPRRALAAERRRSDEAVA